MTKFLLIQSRPEATVSDDEFRAFCHFGGLEETELERLQIHQSQPKLDLSAYNGILMGGGPANFAYDDAHKSPEQRAFESWLLRLLETIIAEDKPFFGACLGMGALVTAAGGQMSLTASEEVGAVEIRVTSDGASDPLFAGISREFHAFVGHKEGVGKMPDGMTVLATNENCVQMVRIGNNVYGAQFHPELDRASLALRIKTYKHAGYFAPEEADGIITAAWESSVDETPTRILHNFVSRYCSNN